MFERLRTRVREDVQRRNGIFDRHDGWKFEFHDDGDQFEASRVVASQAQARDSSPSPRLHLGSSVTELGLSLADREYCAHEPSAGKQTPATLSKRSGHRDHQKRPARDTTPLQG
jgi:hypothetical protein